MTDILNRYRSMLSKVCSRYCHLSVALLAASGCCLVPIAALADAPEPTRQHLAFPGAEGAGRFATGGRGGQVLYVTNLDDSGPGSLRAAVDAKGTRTIVFAVSGTITLKTELRINNGQVTIAGQTAPGDGIALRAHGLNINADDVVVRYIRSRPGDETGEETDSINIARGHRIILDHVSASWSSDEVLSGGNKYNTPENVVYDLTVQWCLISESLNETAAKDKIHSGSQHGFGSLIRGGRGSKFSWHHNLWAIHMDRMPRPGNYKGPDIDPIGGFMDFRSNVFYDWGKVRSGYNNDVEGTKTSYNFIDNAYVAGPDSKGNYAFQEGSPLARAYFAGNSMNGVIPSDPYSLVIVDQKSLPNGLPEGYKLAAPLDVAPVTDDSAPTAYEKVLANAGTSLARDRVDLRVIQDVRTHGGKIINSQNEVGGWPVLNSKPAPKDSDGDGMPDAWERAHSLNPNNPADGQVVGTRTGYTHLEDYLNSLTSMSD